MTNYSTQHRSEYTYFCLTYMTYMTYMTYVTYVICATLTIWHLFFCLLSI